MLRGKIGVKPLFFKAAETGFARFYKVLHWFRKVFARLSRGTCTAFARVLQVCKEFAMVLQVGCKGLAGACKGLARVLQGVCKELARVCRSRDGPPWPRKNSGLGRTVFVYGIYTESIRKIFAIASRPTPFAIPQRTSQ